MTKVTSIPRPSIVPKPGLSRPCMSCRWVRLPFLSRIFGKTDFARCLHPQVRGVYSNLVSGEQEVGAPRFCSNARMLLEPCGPAGTLYEPKER